MPTTRGPSLSQVAQAVVAEMDAPISLDEFVQRVLARYPSRAKNPAQLVRTNLRYEQWRLGLAFLDSKTLVPLRLAMQGVRFRIPLDAEQLKHGAVWYFDWFEPFFKPIFPRSIESAPPTFFDANAQLIPTPLVTIQVRPHSRHLEQLAAMIKGTDEIVRQGIDLHDWLRIHNARQGDSILVTVRDWERAHFTLEFEPRTQRREAEIQAQNKALADTIWDLLQETVDEKLFLSPGIATAYARLVSARDYPGDHWHQVIATDPRMREEMVMIVPADYTSLFDWAWGTRDAVEEQPFTKEQARKVYRFLARAQYSQRAYIIEIIGKHTLGDFDRVMRDAFNLDPSDHLSEFTRVIRRGKGKRPHRSDYGELNPFEDTPARKVRLAGLGLEVGAELEYVYDFGDWFAHTLILESIGDLEPTVKYPRVIPVHKPLRRQRD
ncbi:MAG: plasmid pRiA4b ORF-3 family protein [Anaerolineae bacterium]|nr:plasmid pRiA4b ORF-3 family protein [Anaerolineae bacterium]